MNYSFKNMYQIISSYIEMSDEEWALYSSMLKVKEIKKKEIILTQGTICKDIFFVNNGLLRIFFVDNDGVEKTFHFAQENSFATDYESFLTSVPSNYSIQALEDCHVLIMSHEMLQGGYKMLKYGEKLGRLLAEDYFFLFNHKIQSIYTQTPIERYNYLKIKSPDLFQRVPQHLIASYLNITSVHLSRLINSAK
jgi:CRP-like cAMP-binding protein